LIAYGEHAKLNENGPKIFTGRGVRPLVSSECWPAQWRLGGGFPNEFSRKGGRSVTVEREGWAFTAV